MKTILAVCLFFFSLLFNICFAQQPKLVLPVGHIEKVSVAFNSSGDLLLSISKDKCLIWNAKFGKILFDLQQPGSKIITAVFNSFGNKVLATVDKKGACIFNMNNGEIDYSVSGRNAFITYAVFSKNEQEIIAAFSDSSIVIWNIQQKMIENEFKVPFLVKQIETNEDKNLLAVLFDTLTLEDTEGTETREDKRFINLNTKEIYNEIPKVKEAASKDRFDLSIEKRIVLLTDLKMKKNVQKFEADELWNSIAFMERENRVAIIKGFRLFLWDLTTGREIRKNCFDKKQSIYKIIYIPGNSLLLAYSGVKDSCYVYDYNKDRILLRFKMIRNYGDIPSISYSKNKNRLAYSTDNIISLIDPKKGLILQKLTGHTNSIQSFTYNPFLQKLVSINNYTNIKQWDLLKAKLDFSFEDPTWCATVSNVFYRENNSKIVVDACEDILTEWDVQTGNQIINDSNLSHIGYRFERDSINIAEYFTGNIYAQKTDSTLDFHDLKTDSLLSSIYVGENEIVAMALSPDGKKLITIDLLKKVLIWDVEKRILIKQLYDFTYQQGMDINNDFTDYTFNKNGKYFIIGNNKGDIDLWDTDSLHIIQKFKGKFNRFITDTTIAVINNEAIEFYDAKSKIEKFKLIAIDLANEYMVVLPNGYYCGSNNALKLVHFVKNQSIIGFEQLDVKYNRPDKVLEAIGSTDTALIRSYRKAYEKRIKKLGIDTTAFRDGFSVPEADFANRDNIEYEQKEGKLKLNIKSVDSTYKPDRFNIWVNEAPIFGQRGINLRNKNKNSFDSTVSINLSQGENRIETSITNVNGTESYRMPLLVNYTPANKQTEKIYFIGIGIDQFNDSKYNLKYSTKDIRDLSKKLKEKYKDIIIDTLFNENVNISNVKALKQKLLQTSVNDKVIISYSGHGMLSKDFDYYLSTYSVNFDKPEENGLAYEELESLLDSIPARKKLLLIDACHSGEVDKEDLVALNATDEKLIKGLKPVAYKNEGHLGLKNSFELMQSLFVNVGKSTGAIIISAAAGTQFALEGVDNLPNGVFTYCILEAMNKYPSMKISELKKIVGERVVEITKGLQKPTSRNETIAVDWSIW